MSVAICIGMWSPLAARPCSPVSQTVCKKNSWLPPPEHKGQDRRSLRTQVLCSDRWFYSRVTWHIPTSLVADPSINLIFLCSPGNPTGTLISLASIRALLDYEPFKGIVVVDEAYIDFSESGSSAASLVAEYANICVMQTLSKSFGLAAIRCVRLTITLPPSLVPHPHSTQTRYSDRSTTAHPSSLKYQGTVQYLRSHSSSSTTRFISRIAERYARKHRSTQGIAC